MDARHARCRLMMRLSDFEWAAVSAVLSVAVFRSTTKRDRYLRAAGFAGLAAVLTALIAGLLGLPLSLYFERGSVALIGVFAVLVIIGWCRGERTNP